MYFHFIGVAYSLIELDALLADIPPPTIIDHVIMILWPSPKQMRRIEAAHLRRKRKNGETFSLPASR